MLDKDNNKYLLRRQYKTILDPKKIMSNEQEQQQPAVNTTNAILTEKEALEMQQQQHQDNPNMPPPPNQNQSLTAQETQPAQESRSNTQDNIQQSSNVVPFPQPPIDVVQKAQKPKTDFSSTDATIQGLLVQVIALQHNKIQQINQEQQQ